MAQWACTSSGPSYDKTMPSHFAVHTNRSKNYHSFKFFSLFPRATTALFQRIFPSSMNSTTESKYVDKDEDSKYYMPSAPPPPSHFDYPPTATGVPVISHPPSSNTDNNSTIQFHPKHPVSWSSGLCNCFDDINTCCLTCWCPCITFGRIAEIVDRGSTSCGVSAALYTLILCVTGCSCLYSCFYRSKLRGQYFLEESPCTDCCIHCCCEECSLCQEYRELKHHGFDMSTGWHANMERQKHLDAMAPVVQGTMRR